MLKPKALTPGATIGIVSPARHAPEEWIEKGKAGLERLGFRVVLHPQNFLHHHQLAGTDAQRAAALMDYFADPAIDAIICARGGIGSYRLLNLLDYGAIKKHPKIFCGFSDITTLLTAFYKEAGLTGFSGPMCWNFLDPHPDLAKALADTLCGRMTGKPQTYTQSECVRAGSAEGKLFGGNITLLQNLIGTKWDFDTKDCILFLEDVEERWCAFDRTLYHFYNAGKFAHIKALVIGEMTDMRDDEAGIWGDDFRQVVQKLVPPGIPIVANYPCGHGKLLTPLPMGTRARIETSPESTVLTLVESPFA